jgi:hypothetical protein
MKFSKEHYDSLKAAVVAGLERNGITIQDALKAASELNCSEIRTLWDLFWLSSWSKNNREMADQYIDDHITSAMRKIVKELSNVDCQMNFHEFPGPELSSQCIHCGSKRRN